MFYRDKKQNTGLLFSLLKYSWNLISLYQVYQKAEDVEVLPLLLTNLRISVPRFIFRRKIAGIFLQFSHG